MEYRKEKGKVLVTIGEETKPISQWAKQYGISEKTLSGRIYAGWDEKDLFNKPGQWKPTAKFNEHYFDEIDNEHKAYWLGFIWADGYMAIRNRNDRISYEFKLSLKDSDYHHLEKFNNDLDGKYEVKFYSSASTFSDDTKEARILITNQYFGKTLVEKYGIIPHRTDCSKVISAIPEHLIKHFIRGLLDADGSFVYYQISHNNTMYDKFCVDIGSNVEILNFVEDYFIKNKLINDGKRKINQRHEGQDGTYRSLRFSGRVQTLNILRHLYKNSTIYLDRKYQKYVYLMKVGDLKNEL